MSAISSSSQSTRGDSEAPAKDDESPEFRDLLKSKMVKVTVGPAPSIGYYVHEALLVANSRFFKACLSEAWAGNTREKQVRLPEHDPESFSISSAWCYRGNLDVLLSSTTTIGSDDWPRENALAYKMAHCVQCTTLADAIVDAQSAPQSAHLQRVKNEFRSCSNIHRTHSRMAY